MKFLTTVKVFIRSFRRCALICTHVVIIEAAAASWQTVVTHHQTHIAAGVASYLKEWGRREEEVEEGRSGDVLGTHAEDKTKTLPVSWGI